MADPGATFSAVMGTSFASPITAAAFSVIRQKTPDASVDGILSGFKSTGTTVTEDRTGYSSMQHKSINITAALSESDSFAKYTPQDAEVPVNPVTPSGNTSPAGSSAWVPGAPKAGVIGQAQSISLIVITGILFVTFNLWTLKRGRQKGVR